MGGEKACFKPFVWTNNIALKVYSGYMPKEQRYSSNYFTKHNVKYSLMS